MRILRSILCWTLVVSVALFTLAACGGGGGDSGDGGGTVGTTGVVSVGLTDAATQYNAVVLTIKEVGIVASNNPTTYYNSADLSYLPTTVNVLDFPGDQVLRLADIEFPLPANGDPVCFNQIRMRLAEPGDPDCEDEDKLCNYVIQEGDPTLYPLITPSGQTSGVKVLTPNEFCASPGDDTVQVVIDFDPAYAIVDNPQKFILKPTGMRIIEGDFFRGFISGTVAVPAESNAATMECVPFESAPEVTVDAREAGETGDPVTTTMSMTEGPLSAAEVCGVLCGEDQACVDACVPGLLNDCYYLGGYKLLLPMEGNYDVEARWGDFSASKSEVPSGTEDLFLELLPPAP